MQGKRHHFRLDKFKSHQNEIYLVQFDLKNENLAKISRKTCELDPEPASKRPDKLDPGPLLMTWQVGLGSGMTRQIERDPDPDPKLIVSDPQHCTSR